jgi:hypothetical protein
MTLKEHAIKFLEVRGIILAEWREEIFERVKTAPENEAMVGRWGDLVENHSALVLNGIENTVCEHAIAWIDENKPRAFFRKLFVRNEELLLE